jgi:hypothetical protein
MLRAVQHSMVVAFAAASSRHAVARLAVDVERDFR